MKRTLLTIGIAIISMCGCFGQKMPKLHNEVIEASKEYQMGNAFQKDLLLYVDMLGKTHPYYAEKKNVARLNRDAKKWYKECGNITDTLKFAAFLQTITIPLNDGHTAVRYWDSFEKVFPIGVIIDGDSPAIVNVTSKDMKDCLGKSIKTINGKSLKDILNIARPYVSADNWLNYEDLVAQFFSFADFWKVLDMSNELLDVVFDDGTEVEIKAVSRTEVQLAKLEEKVSTKFTARRKVLFEYEILENESICYLQFNQFADRMTHPNHPELPRFDFVLLDMMKEIDEKNIETLVIDLQYNGGGNSALGQLLMSWLHPFNKTNWTDVDVRISDLLCELYPKYRNYTINEEPLEIGKVYDMYSFDQTRPNMDYQVPEHFVQDTSSYVVNLDPDKIFKGNVIFIESRGSLSSSEMLLTTSRDNGVGIIVGETSGANPCNYGDILYSILPNTSTLVGTSCKYFTRVNKDLLDEEYLVPDVLIDLDDPEKDLVWEWILNNYGKQR